MSASSSASQSTPTPFDVKQYLAENGDLIEAAHERLSLGRLHESLQYQLKLQQNLLYLGTYADDDSTIEQISFARAAAAAAEPPPPEATADTAAPAEQVDPLQELISGRAARQAARAAAAADT